jgi:hypothetical protein
MRGLRPTVALILLLVTAQAPCQNAAQAGGISRKLLLVVRNEGAAEITQTEILLMEKSLGLALQNASASLRIVEYGNAEFPPDLEKRIETSQATQTDCWLWVGVSGERTSLALRLNSYDLLLQATVVDEALPFEGSLATVSTLEGGWDNLVSLMLGKFQITRTGQSPGGGIDTASGPRTALLTIKARPGTVVTGLPAGRLEIGFDGAVIASLDAPAAYTFRAWLGGYDPVTLNVFLDDNMEVSLNQEPGAKWAVDTSFFNSLFPGVDGRYYFIPNWLFMELGCTTYFFGLRLGSDQAIFSFPLANLILQFGGYITAEDSFMRLYGAAGAFLRVVFAADVPVRFDPLSSYGFQVAVGSQFMIAGDFRFFAELVPMLYMSNYPDLFHASLGPDVQFGYIFFPWGTLSLANIRFGVRWLP